jgi:hypothetical protein
MNTPAKLERLSVFPPLVERALSGVPDPLLHRRAADGTFALVEHAWHLYDLESDAYRVRIARLLSESAPHFPDFRGDVIAEARKYLTLPLRDALVGFNTTRAANVRRVRGVSGDQWSRSGTQENVGFVTLATLVDAMLKHDNGHANEIVALLRELGLPVPGELAAFAHEGGDVSSSAA